jgi:hypothetical protein
MSAGGGKQKKNSKSLPVSLAEGVRKILPSSVTFDYPLYPEPNKGGNYL